MRDPFDVQQHVHAARRSSSEFIPTTMPSNTGYMLENGEGGSWAPTSDSLIRHQYQKMSDLRNVRDEFSNALLDPEITELCSRSRSQEEEILLLRKQISDACVQELQLLQEKHVLERRLSDLRMALDEKQDDAISDALKELGQRKGYIEENIRLAHDLKVAEEEVYVFTSSLLSLLAEYNIRLPLLNASTITNNTKRLYQRMDWKIRSSGASLDEVKRTLGNQAGDATSNIDRQPPRISNNQLSQQHLDSRMTEFHHYNQYPIDFQVATSQSRFAPVYDMMDVKGVKAAQNPDLQYKEFPSTITKEAGGTVAPSLREDPTYEATTRREIADTHNVRQTSPGSDDDISFPGIEGFQIIGEAKPGSTLRACGFPTNGTSLCIFQWVRHLENGTRQSIEGATVPDYVVTADDVDTFLAVDCIPMDDSGRQGEIVSLFANNQNKITCDPDMQNAIESHISSGRDIFTVFLLEYSLPFDDIPAERRIAIDKNRAKAKKFKDGESSSSEEEDEPNYKNVGEIKMDKVSTSEGKGSEPGSGSQGSSGMLRPVIFFDYEIHEATNNLSDSLKIGEGGYGSVYKGYIDDTDVAIKMLSNTGYQGIREFHRETGALGLVRHAKLVNLIGTCFQLRALVYEYVPNGSLEDCLKKEPAELTWQIRTRIVYEICTTLRFLHANLPDPLIHGDLKPHNVLLDSNFKTKLADFGLCRFLTQDEKSHMMKTFDGSTDYIDPDFLESGIVRPAIDVYSFGKTIIRILTGEQPTEEISRKVHEARKTNSLMTIVDPAARGWPEKIVTLLARFSLKCRTNKRNDPEYFSQFPTQLKMVSGNIVA